jgi:hypothetical protein
VNRPAGKRLISPEGKLEVNYENSDGKECNCDIDLIRVSGYENKCASADATYIIHFNSTSPGRKLNSFSL